MPEYEAVIGLEVHAELLTRSKMFCACPVVDLTEAEPNTAVCEVVRLAGGPGPGLPHRPGEHLCPQELLLSRPP